MPDIAHTNDELAPEVPTGTTPTPDAATNEMLVRKFAKAQGVDPDLMVQVMKTESGGRSNAVSTKGAVGAMQLEPGAAADVGVDRNDPVQNALGGVMYFKKMLDKYGGNQHLAAAAYNAGPGTMDKVLAGQKDIPSETSQYLNNIFGENQTPSWAKVNPIAALAPRPPQAHSDDELAPDNSTPLHNAAAAVPGYFDAAMNNLDVGGGILGGMAGEALAPYGGGVPMAGLGAQVGRRFTQLYQQKFDPDNAPQTPLEAQQQMFDSVKRGVIGEVGNQALRLALPSAQQWIYSKLTGADPQNVAEQEGLAALTRDKIPLGVGQAKAIEKWKAPDNATIDNLIQKYSTPTQVIRPGQAIQNIGAVNPVGVWGDIFKYYSKDTNIPLPEIEAAIGKRGAALVENMRQGVNITPANVKAALQSSEENGIFGKYLGRKVDPQNPANSVMGLSDTRKIKQAIDANDIPYGERTKGQQQAFKTVRYFLNQHMAEAIPAGADRDAFVKAAGNLETKIDAEDVANKLQSKGRGSIISNPAARSAVAPAIGASVGLYGHNPWAGLGVGAGAALLSGRTVPSFVGNLGAYPATSQILSGLTRFSPEGREKISNNVGEDLSDVAGKIQDLLQRFQQ